MLVQFQDSTEQVIVSYFGSPQDPAYYPNLGTVDTSDPRWRTFYELFPSWMSAGMPPPD